MLINCFFFVNLLKIINGILGTDRECVERGVMLQNWLFANYTLRFGSTSLMPLYRFDVLSRLAIDHSNYVNRGCLRFDSTDEVAFLSICYGFFLQ